MYFQLLLLAVLIASLLHRSKVVDWNQCYLDKSTTATINGFFICLVFMTHFSQYSSYMYNVVAMLRQYIVASFLFYSGYGCCAQFIKKGPQYLKAFPVQRILPVFVNFNIAVFSFLLLGLFLGHEFTFKQLVLSSIGWDSLGNSNWYIFVIILCYGAFWLSFSLICWIERMFGVGQNCAGGGGVVFLLISLMAWFISHFKASFWYDTMMVFAAGVLWCIYRTRFEHIIKERYAICLMVLSLCFLAVDYLPYVGPRHLLAFNLKSIMVAMLVMMLSMKMQLNSPWLRWCGDNLFAIYIYQRIPMILFSAIDPAGFNNMRSLIYFLLSAFVTIGIAYAYPYFRFRWPIFSSNNRCA